MSMTRCRDFIVKMDAGLHLRSAALLVKTAHGFDARIAVSNGQTTVDGKSFLSLIIMGATQGARLRVATEGPDAKELMDAVAELFECGFGEPCTGFDLMPAAAATAESPLEAGSKP